MSSASKIVLHSIPNVYQPQDLKHRATLPDYSEVDMLPLHARAPLEHWNMSPIGVSMTTRTCQQ